jgi:hypothetical protein
MGMHETITDGHSLSGGDTAAPVLENAAGASPKMALAPADLTPKAETPRAAGPEIEAPKIEAPKTEAPAIEAIKPDLSKIGAPANDPPRIEIPKTATGTRKLATVEAPRIAPDMDEPKPSTQQAEVGAGDAGGEPAAEGTGPRVSRFTLLAASLALAAALAGMIASAAGYVQAPDAPRPAGGEGRV